MLVLFDQGTPVQIRNFLHDHTVKTAREQGWSTLLNGELLREAEAAGFQVLLTTDKNMIHKMRPAERLRLSRWAGRVGALSEPRLTEW